MLSSIINATAIVISLSTTTGVLLHESHLDKVGSMPVILPETSATIEGQNSTISSFVDAHIDFQRNSLSQAVHELKSPTPSIQPRSHDKKHLMQKHILKGHHGFDGYNIPIE